MCGTYNKHFNLSTVRMYTHGIIQHSLMNKTARNMQEQFPSAVVPHFMQFVPSNPARAGRSGLEWGPSLLCRVGIR